MKSSSRSRVVREDQMSTDYYWNNKIAGLQAELRKAEEGYEKSKAKRTAPKEPTPAPTLMTTPWSYGFNVALSAAAAPKVDATPNRPMTFEERRAYADKVVETEFVMTPPVLEDMKGIVAEQSSGGQFKVRAETIIRHQFSNYEELIHEMEDHAIIRRFKYMVSKTIRAFVNSRYLHPEKHSVSL